ncbi:ATP-dependent DNA helicase RecG [Paraburkholderia bannensis]|uniref:ATP-dependent DNA helicase RecG n=1 Tax=Paraburkholderia bannensis TaxID=765414 RepID=A0A7W9WV20_9BURK|nr:MULTISPECIES: ATP-binding protein [Paraburkholderia]MBB3260018.1 ATP-dependent DNA helicase RecG [Paraburkholderia sp. WP4_3_2]MBB6105224.1 ATP-dependent DNA helicase RecG [Paraburkholderia bannensis]
MAIEIFSVPAHNAQKIIATRESHYADIKAIEIQPAKLTETICAFANADGGELYIGIDDPTDGQRQWRGFKDPEAANGHLQIFEKLFPLGQSFEYNFLECNGFEGLVLQVAIKKTSQIMRASNGNIYVRRGAAKHKLTAPEEIRRLEYSKGIASFETEIVNVDPEEITNSEEVIRFMLEVVPQADPEGWLKKQQLLVGGRPTVCGVLLFAEQPQALMPKRCGVKIYRYKTSDQQGSRDTLAFLPVTVEGPINTQIRGAVAETIKVVQQAKTLGSIGLEDIQYPSEAIHEIVTNALIHRDYSLADDVHIRVFDNRVEVESPGPLAAHITTANILDERFARNGSLVRLLNKFPDPPNQDVGEGLNTAFDAMRKLGLKEPIITNKENSVLVTVRHERLASHEQLILEYLQDHPSIRNKQARELCYVDADYKMKRILGRLEDRQLIEKVPGTIRNTTAYQRGALFEQWRSIIALAPEVSSS